MPDQLLAHDSPIVPVLLLGDSRVGKSTFLNALVHINRGERRSPSLLRDEDQPFIFQVNIRGHHVKLELSDTASPEHYSQLDPAVIIFCYDVSSRESLRNAREAWLWHVQRLYKVERPMMLMALKRDLRKQEMKYVDPEEGLQVAQEMRCDRYLECSAQNGELMKEVLEDISITAAGTLTDGGGFSKGKCTVM